MVLDFERIASELSDLKIKTVGSGTDGDGGSTRHRRAAPFFIGVAGGTASGKTTVCDCIMQRLHDQCVVMLSQDSFYRGLTPEESANVKGEVSLVNRYTFLVPSNFEGFYCSLAMCVLAGDAREFVNMMCRSCHKGGTMTAWNRKLQVCIDFRLLQVAIADTLFGLCTPKRE